MNLSGKRPCQDWLSGLTVIAGANPAGHSGNVQFPRGLSKTDVARQRMSVSSSHGQPRRPPPPQPRGGGGGCLIEAPWLSWCLNDAPCAPLTRHGASIMLQ
eukprot:COSAG01_NODE_3393_length_6149_cov_24.742149_7_plen_101_part_00